MVPNPYATNTFNVNLCLQKWGSIFCGNINGMNSMEECTVKITCGSTNITYTLPQAGAPDTSGDTHAKIFANKIPVPGN
jgi:hypothetical protein